MNHRLGADWSPERELIPASKFVDIDYSAADAAVTSDGEVFFTEVNAQFLPVTPVIGASRGPLILAWITTDQEDVEALIAGLTTFIDGQRVAELSATL